MKKNIKKKIVVIGGGTGTFVVLSGLKKYPVDLTAIVTMADSGGSSGVLRDELGVLPPGDIRQCLVALSQSEALWRKLFVYRFENGCLRGHNFGNIFLSALEKVSHGNFEKAVEKAGEILDIEGRVLPVTLTKTDLAVELENGQRIFGETNIDEPKHNGFLKIKKAWLQPAAKINPKVKEEMQKATAIVLGPGDLYTSIIPNLLVKEVSLAIRKSAAKKIFVMNLMTKFGQTTNYKASDHLNDLEKYLGKNILDCVILNTKKPSGRALQWYAKQKEKAVENDLSGRKIIKAALLKDIMMKKNQSDKLKRSLIRHNAFKLAKILMQII